MPVGQNVRTSNLTVNWGDGSILLLYWTFDQLEIGLNTKKKKNNSLIFVGVETSSKMICSSKIESSDTTSFGRKSNSQMSFTQHITVMPVGQNVRTSNITLNWGDGSILLLYWTFDQLEIGLNTKKKKNNSRIFVGVKTSSKMICSWKIESSDTTSFGRKSISQMWFSQHIILMPVGQNVRTSSYHLLKGWELS